MKDLGLGALEEMKSDNRRTVTVSLLTEALSDDKYKFLKSIVFVTYRYA